MNGQSASTIRIGLRCAALCLALLLGAMGPLLSEPPSERTLVHAVADTDRVLVRWLQVEGTERRFSHYDLLRRESDQASFVVLNNDPIGALDSIAEIQALFGAAGNEDALASIQESFGQDYASDLLALQSPGASSTQRAQLKLIPDLNYGAALALGLGWMDETAVPGTTYVYEVWGLDELGFREERLGRASAAAGALDPLPAIADADCVDMGDNRSDMVAYLRWEEATAAESRYITGYDVYRAPRNPDTTCPPNGPGAPGSVKVNLYPTLRDAAGSVTHGEQLFVNTCATSGCHIAADPREELPANDGVKGGTIAGFRRLQYPDLVVTAHHDTTALNALSPESVRAIFDWVHEFHYMDAAIDTPQDPLEEGEWYCYRVLGRDLLGQHGLPPAQDLPCQVRDREPPQVPWGMNVERVQQGDTHEICEVSWQRNDDPDDDTTQYELYRTPEMPRAGHVAAPSIPLATIPHPPSGLRVTYPDMGLAQESAGERFYYAVRARDDANNLSPFGGWIPCVPRDIVAPPPGTLTLECCERGAALGCVDRGQDPAWTSKGGDDVIITDPGRCPIEVIATQPEDTFGVRSYRSFDGQNFAAGTDFKGSYSEDFAPLIDTKIWTQARGFDRSGNLGGFFDSKYWIAKGTHKLPPPRIISVALLPGLPGHVKIRFRALRPDVLLGFALYKHNKEPDEAVPAGLGDFVVRYHDQNLSTDLVVPEQWAVLPTAQTLDDLLDNEPPTANTYLYYDDLDHIYEMQVDVGDDSGLVLNLVAVGWSGEEGNYLPYVWDGLVPGDGVLDWPLFRTSNTQAQQVANDLLPGYSSVYPPSIVLTWTASPDGCVDDVYRPFVVFRRRGSSPRWEQISPTFGCDNQNTQLVYRDFDIEPSMNYTYAVIRLDYSGEFLAWFGPATESVP